MYPYGNVGPKGILSGLKKFNFNNFLDGAQKTLSVANQVVPLVYQVSPIINNVKTLFKISNVINENDTPKNNNTSSGANDNSNKPIFYV